MLQNLQYDHAVSLLTEEELEMAPLASDYDPLGLDRLTTAILNPPELKKSGKLWAQWSVKEGDPWQLMQDNFHQIYAAPSGDWAFCVLFEEAFRIASTPEMRDEVNNLVSFFLDGVQNKIAKVENKKGMRWSDISRAFLRPLRFLRDNWCPENIRVKIFIEDIQLCTMESDAPWIDSYTGEIDQEVLDDLEFGYSIKFPTLETMSPEERMAMMSSEAFNDNFDDEEDFFTDAMPDDQRPMWMQIQDDSQAHELDIVDEDVLKWRIKDCRDFCRKLFRNGAPLAMVKQEFDQSQVKADLINTLITMGELDGLYHIRPEDIVGMIGPLCTEYMFDVEDFEVVKFQYNGSYPTLADAIDDLNQYEPFDMVQDVGGKMVLPVEMRATDESTLQWELEKFSEETIEALIKDAPEVDKASKPQLSKPFLKAYLEAQINARHLQIKRNGKSYSAAVQAGWDAWREAISPEGAQAYRLAIAQGKTNTEAMKAFKAELKKDGVKSLKPSGLVLTSGRFVNWRIAAIKLKENELRLTQDERSRLKQALSSRGIAPEFAALL